MTQYLVIFLHFLQGVDHLLFLHCVTRILLCHLCVRLFGLVCSGASVEEFLIQSIGLLQWDRRCMDIMLIQPSLSFQNTYSEVNPTKFYSTFYLHLYNHLSFQINLHILFLFDLLQRLPLVSIEGKEEKKSFMEPYKNTEPTHQASENISQGPSRSSFTYKVIEILAMGIAMWT